MKYNSLPVQLAAWLNEKYQNQHLKNYPEFQLDLGQLVRLLYGNPIADFEFNSMPLNLFDDVVAAWERIVDINWNNTVIIARLLEQENPDISLGALPSDALTKKVISLPNFKGSTNPSSSELDAIVNVWMFLTEEI